MSNRADDLGEDLPASPPAKRRYSSSWSSEDAERHLRSLELFGMRFGLDRMRRMMTALHSPERRFETIHVLGTNGKSSTTRMIAAILERHGLRTGTYTSPHLISYTERVQVGERDLDGDAFAAAIARASGYDRHPSSPGCAKRSLAAHSASSLSSRPPSSVPSSRLKSWNRPRRSWGWS